jgi:hypothetical protein
MIYKVDRSVEQVVDEILVMDCQSGRNEAEKKGIGFNELLKKLNLRKRAKR